MTLPRATRHLLMLTGLLLPVAAHAGAVVLSPLVPERTVNKDRISDLFGLMSSELEFMAGVDEVIELDPIPPALTLSCLDSTRCLYALAHEKGGDALITGSVEEVGSDLSIDLLYYDVASNKVLRRKTWVVPSSASELVDSITPILVELTTGKSPVKEEAQDAQDFAESNDDLSFDRPVAAPAPAPAPAPVRTPTPAPAPSRATTSGTARTVDLTIAPPPTPAPRPLEDAPSEDDGFDPNAFSFDSSSGDSSYAAPAPAPRPAPAPAPRPAPAPAPVYVDEEEYQDRRPVAADDFADEDEPYRDPADEDPRDSRASSSSRSTSRDEDYAPRDTRDEDDARDDRYTDDSRDDRYAADTRDDRSSYQDPRSSRTTTSRKRDDEWRRRLTVPIRGGYSHFGIFDFATVGAEVQVRAVAGLNLLVGITPSVVQRQLPPEAVDTCNCKFRINRQGQAIQNNWLFPINAGLLYRFDKSRFQPYIGADVSFAQYYVDPTTRQRRIAVGAGGRLGMDIMISRNFGVNVDADLGFWTGNYWNQIDSRFTKSMYFLPRLAGGVVVGF